MLVANALRVLAPHAKVKVTGRHYQATIWSTTITFRAVRGQVTDLRCRGRGREERRPKNLTRAVRDALHRARPIGRPEDLDLLLAVSIDHRGRTFEPVACFMLMGFEPIKGAAGEWTDTDALAMATAVIVGQVPDGLILDWLEERDDEFGKLIRHARQSLSDESLKMRVPTRHPQHSE